MTDRRRVTIAESVEQAKREIWEMLAKPVQTSRGFEAVTMDQITSFSDLHDYCDANMLGWMCNGGENGDVVFVDAQGEIPAGPDSTDADNDRWMEFCNAVSDQVDHWIKNDGHKVRTRVVPSEQAGYGPGRWQAQYQHQGEPWYDIGDPTEHRHAAYAKAAAHGGVPERSGDCPACGTGTLMLTVQAMVGRPAQGGPWHVFTVTEDDFVSMDCDNVACLWSLAQSPGDGRLRRATLTLDGLEVEDRDDLLRQFIEVAEKAISRPEPN